MEIKIELDLPGIIGAAVTAERLQPLVDKAISDAIKEAISSATGYRSKFREELNKQLGEAMPHGLSIDDCAKFQQVLNMSVSAAVHSSNAQTIQAAMQAAVKHSIPDVPARIKISELIAEARNGFHRHAHEAFYAQLEMSDYGNGVLYLDEDSACRNQYHAKVRVSFTKDGDIYAVRMDGVDLTPKSLPTIIGSFEGLLLSMYVGRTSLEIDCDADEVESLAAASE